MEGSEDIASEEWDAKVKPIVKEALAKGRIPIECIKWVDVGDFEVKTVVFHEC